MLTAPKPRSRKRRVAAATMTSRDPPRRVGRTSFRFFRASIRIHIALISACKYIAPCNATQGLMRLEEPLADPGRRSCSAEASVPTAAGGAYGQILDPGCLTRRDDRRGL